MSARAIYLIVFEISLVSCGKYVAPNTEPAVDNGHQPTVSQPPTNTPVITPPVSSGSSPVPGTPVIKSRTIMSVNLNAVLSQQKLKAFVFDNNIPVSVVNAPSTIVVIDNSNLHVPQISHDIISLGSIRIAQLYDNDLAKCGNNGATQCSQAVIRMYTIGVGGAGFYNSETQYSAPLSAGQNTSTMFPVGLNIGGAVVLQSISINNLHVLTLSNFKNLVYNVEVDFTNADAGNYSTTLVVEYVLS